MRLATISTALTLTLALGLTSFAQAQDMPGPDGGQAEPKAQEQQRDRRAERRRREMDRAIQQMVERLGLNEEHSAKVREVINANLAQLEQVRNRA